MSWTLSSSQAIIFKAGSGVDSTAASSGAILQKYSDLAEAEFCVLTRKDWITGYSGVSTNFKPVIDDAVSDLGAIKLISYNMAGYTSRTEAQTILDVLRDNAMRIIDFLKDKANQKFSE